MARLLLSRGALLLLPLLLLLLLRSVCHVDATTVFFRKATCGNIFALAHRSADNSEPHETELDGTADAARLVALTLGRSRLYWSDHRSIRSARTRDGSDVRTDVGTLVRVHWHGVHFGAARDELLELTVLGTRCVSVSAWSPTDVECLVAVPLVDAAPQEDDCVIRTTHGEMRGVARNRFDELRASGVVSPIVESLTIDATAVAPHALAVDKGDQGDQDNDDVALFWANAIDGAIYRSSLRDTAIAVVQRDVWEVKGVVLLRWPVTHTLELLYSLEGKGRVQRTSVVETETTTPPGEIPAPQTVLRGLRSPRGLALDPTQQFLYITEKTGRLYRAALDTMLTSMAPQLSTSEPSQLPLPPSQPQPQLLVTRPTLTRLDGLAVDDAFVYWTESSHTNVVARAPLDSFERHVLVGGSADSALSWPRGIALASSDGARNAAHDDFYYVEYTGRVAKGKAQVLVDELRASSMRYLDQLIQRRDAQTHVYALE